MRFDPAKIRADLFWSRVERADGCWPWTAFVDGKGYGRFSVPTGRKGGSWSEGAHRIAWVLTNGPIPDGMHVLHNCDNPRCARPDHLRLGTHADNMADMRLRGRAKKAVGEASACARLTWPQVREIRAHPNPDVHAMGAHYGVTANNIRAILARKTWPEHGIALGGTE
jgi:hypothetical protein